MSIFRSAASCKRGQSVVEFTLAAPLFFVAFYAIVEFSHLFYVRLTVQHALDEAGRYMSTGQGQSITDPNARLNAIKQVFCSNLVATGLGCPQDNDSEFAFTLDPSNGGGPGDLSNPQPVTITLRFRKPFFTGFFGLNPIPLTISTTYQNEPYITLNPTG